MMVHCLLPCCDILLGVLATETVASPSVGSILKVSQNTLPQIREGVLEIWAKAGFPHRVVLAIISLLVDAAHAQHHRRCDGVGSEVIHGDVKVSSLVLRVNVARVCEVQ